MDGYHHKEDGVMKETRAFSKSLYVFCLCLLFSPSANFSSFQFLDLSLKETDHFAVRL